MYTGLSVLMIAKPARNINRANPELTTTTVWSMYFLELYLCSSNTPFIERIRPNEIFLHSVASKTTRTRLSWDHIPVKNESNSLADVVSSNLIATW